MGYWKRLKPTEKQLERIAEYEGILGVKFNVKNKEQASHLIGEYKSTGTLRLVDNEDGKGGKVSLINVYYTKV